MKDNDLVYVPPPIDPDWVLDARIAMGVFLARFDNQAITLDAATKAVQLAAKIADAMQNERIHRTNS